MAKDRTKDLTRGTPWKVIAGFSLPVIGGNLFQLFYTLADSVIVGKTLGADSLVAVGATSIVVYFVLCFIQGMTSGFGICLGQRYGAEDDAAARKDLSRLFRSDAYISISSEDRIYHGFSDVSDVYWTAFHAECSQCAGFSGSGRIPGCLSCESTGMAGCVFTACAGILSYDTETGIERV